MTTKTNKPKEEFIEVLAKKLGTPYTKKMLEKLLEKEKKKYSRGGGIRKPKW